LSYGTLEAFEQVRRAFEHSHLKTPIFYLKTCYESIWSFLNFLERFSIEEFV